MYLAGRRPVINGQHVPSAFVFQCAKTTKVWVGASVNSGDTRFFSEEVNKALNPDKMKYTLSPLHKDVLEHGVKSFKQIEEIRTFDIEDAKKTKALLIDKYKATDPAFGYNVR